MPKKLTKIRDKNPSIREIVRCFEAVVKMANSMYWLHPEYELKQDFVESYLRVHYPGWSWYVCVRENTIKINI